MEGVVADFDRGVTDLDVRQMLEHFSPHEIPRTRNIHVN
jgi:hypothetical protein